MFVFLQSTKIGTHENKAIHSILMAYMSFKVSTDTLFPHNDVVNTEYRN